VLAGLAIAACAAIIGGFLTDRYPPFSLAA
jgi:hypothetical protein